MSATRRSSSSRPRGIRRWVERCCPSTRHARRSEIPSRSRTWSMDWRRRGLVILLFLMGLLYGVNLTLVTTSLPAKVESKQYRNQAKLSNNCSNDWHGCIYDVDRRSCRPRNGKPLNRRNYGLGRSCGVCVRNGFGTATRNLADVVARVSDRRVTKGPGRTVDTYRMVGVVPYSRETLHPIFPATFHGSALCARPQVREESAGTSAVSTSGTWR